MREIETRPATRSDIGGLSHTLARAFADDPVMKWMLPDDRMRRRRLPRLFAALTKYQHLGHGGVEVALSADGIGAAALWDPPGKWHQTRGAELRAVPMMLLTFGTRCCAARPPRS